MRAKAPGIRPAVHCTPGQQPPEQRASISLCLTHYSFFNILRPCAAYVLGAGACRSNMCLSDDTVFEPHRNSNSFKVHTDKGVPYVKTRISPYFLQCHRVRKALKGGSGKGAPCLGNRAYIDDLRKGHRITLYDYGTVEMLAALCRKVQTMRPAHTVYSLKESLCRLRTGVRAYAAAAHLAGGASHNKDTPRRHSRRSDQFLCGGCRLCFKLFIFHNNTPFTVHPNHANQRGRQATQSPSVCTYYLLLISSPAGL